MSDNRAWVYHDPSVNAYVYRASSLGNCIRSLTSARLGEDAFPFNASIRAAMDASSGLEDEILHRFSIEMASGDIIWQQKEVELPVEVLSPDNRGVGKVIVRGHLDGLAQLDDTILEVKALGDANWDKYMSGGNVLAGLDALGTLGDKYRIQMGIYGHATGRKVRLVVGHKVKKECQSCGGVGEIQKAVNATGMCFDCMGTGVQWKIDEVDIGPPKDPSDLYSLSDLHARIQFIEECAAKDELPSCDSSCRPGDPYDECHVFEGPKSADDRLSTLIANYITERALEEQHKQLKDQARESIITEYGIGKYAAGSLNARVEHVKPTQRIDSKKLKKELPDIYEQYSTWGAPTIRLTVTGGPKDE